MKHNERDDKWFLEFPSEIWYTCEKEWVIVNICEKCERMQVSDIVRKTLKVLDLAQRHFLKCAQF